LTGSETEEEARTAEKEPVQIPEFPTFKDVHAQRIHMKQKLAAGFRLLAKFGWDEGKELGFIGTNQNCNLINISRNF
jgi:hypothetical protein